MRKRDWEPGCTQVGLFMRQTDGSTIEWEINAAPDNVVKIAAELLRAMAIARPRGGQVAAPETPKGGSEEPPLK
jgi:hypothetical protein